MWRKAARSAGAQSLEACMASSITQAREGTLYLMVGGDEAVFKKVEPILRDMSTSLRHIGRTGEAAKVKALVNMVMNINTAGLAEGARPGRRARSRSGDAARSFFANRRQLARAGDRRRRYAKPRALLLLLRERTPRRTPALLLALAARPRAQPAARRRQRKRNTIAWSRRTLANSTNPASQN